MSGIGIQALAFIGYAVKDLAKSREFYGEILGLPEGMVFEHEGEVGWVEYEIPGGGTLAITPATEQWQPSEHGGGACFEVADLEGAVAKLERAGVPIVLPAQDYPFCRIALIADPSGNTVALHQRKPNHPEGLH